MGGLILFLILFGIPAIEIGLFVLIGGEIGVWSTLGVVLLTAIVGTALVRAQGLSVIRELNGNMERGELPISAMVSGVCLVLAGILLVTPGFLTDAIGFILLIPWTRNLLGAGLVTGLAKHGTFRTFSAGGATYSNRYGPGAPGRGPTIDGEYEDVSAANSNTAGASTTQSESSETQVDDVRKSLSKMSEEPETTKTP